VLFAEPERRADAAHVRAALVAASKLLAGELATAEVSLASSSADGSASEAATLPPGFAQTIVGADLLVWLAAKPVPSEVLAALGDGLLVSDSLGRWERCDGPVTPAIDDSLATADPFQLRRCGQLEEMPRPPSDGPGATAAGAEPGASASDRPRPPGRAGDGLSAGGSTGQPEPPATGASNPGRGPGTGSANPRTPATAAVALGPVAVLWRDAQGRPILDAVPVLMAASGGMASPPGRLMTTPDSASASPGRAVAAAAESTSPTDGVAATLGGTTAWSAQTASDFGAAGLWLRFHGRFHPDWNDWVLSSAWPRWWLHQLERLELRRGVAATAEQPISDRRLAAVEQLLPALSVAGREGGAETRESQAPAAPQPTSRTPEWLLWGVVAVALAAERWWALAGCGR
jgi:hypothetical protein